MTDKSVGPNSSDRAIEKSITDYKEFSLSNSQFVLDNNPTNPRYGITSPKVQTISPNAKIAQPLQNME